jgi:hypothetical protein
MKMGFESEAGGATGLCEQGEGGFRPPLLSLVSVGCVAEGEGNGVGQL